MSHHCLRITASRSSVALAIVRMHCTAASSSVHVPESIRSCACASISLTWRKPFERQSCAPPAQPKLASVRSFAEASSMAQSLGTTPCPVSAPFGFGCHCPRYSKVVALAVLGLSLGCPMPRRSPRIRWVAASSLSTEGGARAFGAPLGSSHLPLGAPTAARGAPRRSSWPGPPLPPPRRRPSRTCRAATSSGTPGSSGKGQSTEGTSGSSKPPAAPRRSPSRTCCAAAASAVVSGPGLAWTPGSRIEAVIAGKRCGGTGRSRRKGRRGDA
mmetsp:Transcript_90686/g.240931  ORF Transcript_90686/g.240931 Transcript_90686/m.240931 type:complete len:271 (+) Transcript_90686:362-1174(+)